MKTKTEGAFSRILVPTDFSAGSEKAWRIARQMAAVYGVELTLLHVLPASPLDMETMLEKEEQRAELRSLQAAHQLGIPRGDDPEATAPVPRVFPGPLEGDATQAFSEAGRAWALRLEQWASLASLAGCTVRTLLRVGVPHREIIETAKEMQADLVLLATHGRGEVHRFLVGSVADKVIRMAPCPVLTVKQA
jgi:nucleotide-binding universal stress UspA family protein